MAKPFFEVFPELKITDQLRGLLNLVQVEKVTSTRDRSQIRVYLKSPRLIHKKNIYDLEKGIKDQLFPDKQLEIKVLEKYNLSEQYTPRKLLEIYKDSLLLELKHYSIVEYNIFRKAEIEFEGQDRMTLTVEDTMVNRDRVGELKRVLEKVFAERCGLPMEVSYRYVPAQGSKLRKQLEERMEEEARAIYWKNHRDELEAMGEGGQTGAPAAVALA
ncbi:PolC-type DNA polymerase III N-terminal domain-containing protein, partial [Enterocloster asparagiformis]